MISRLLQKVKFLPSKIKREIYRLPVLSSLLQLAYKSELEKYAAHLPTISLIDRAVVVSLQQEGVFVSSLAKLDLSPDLLISSTSKLLPKLSIASNHQKPNYLNLNSAQMMDYPEIVQWGMQERLLSIITKYIGLPVLYLGADLRREIVNGKLTDVRQWHTDPEDYRMLKIIIYLNDVSEDNGSFQYISKDLTALAIASLKYNSGFVVDRVMQQVVPISNWQSCNGGAGTIIFADTCNILHRIKAPVVCDRLSLTFSYTSQKFVRVVRNQVRIALAPRQDT